MKQLYISICKKVSIFDRFYCFWSVKGCGAWIFVKFNFLVEEKLLLKFIDIFWFLVFNRFLHTQDSTASLIIDPHSHPKGNQEKIYC